MESLTSVKYPADSKNALTVGNVTPRGGEDSSHSINGLWAKSAAGQLLGANREYAYPVETNTWSTPLVIAGFGLYCRAAATATFTFRLYRADATGRYPTGSPLRQTTRSIETNWARRFLASAATRQPATASLQRSMA